MSKHHRPKKQPLNNNGHNDTEKMGHKNQTNQKIVGFGNEHRSMQKGAMPTQGKPSNGQQSGQHEKPVHGQNNPHKK